MDSLKTENSTTNSPNAISQEPNDIMVLTGSELLKMTVTDQELWFVDGLIPDKGLTILTGASDCSKSTLVRQLAILVASRAKEFLGRGVNTNRTKVLYLSTEDSDVGTSVILKKQAGELGISNLDHLVFSFGNGNVNKLVMTYCDNLPALIIIDTMADLLSGNPNDMINVRNQLDSIVKFAIKYSCPIICLHHNGKYSEGKIPSKNLLNGSQAFEAKARCVLELRKDNSVAQNGRLLTIVKCNYLPESVKSKGIPLVLNTEGLILTTVVPQQANLFGLGSDNIVDDSWRKALEELRAEGVSFNDCHKILAERFPLVKIPGTTKLKDLGRDFPKGEKTKS